MPDTYTHGHHASVLRAHTWRTAENSAGYLLDRLSPAHRLLDVGCGPATITCDLATRVDSVVGIEPVEGILEKAEATKAERGADNVQFETGDVYSLRYDDDSFDVAHAHQVLQHLTDPVQAIREMVRVTKPGGVVAFRDADYYGMTWHPQPPEFDRWMEVYQAVARRNDAEPNGGRFLLSWALEAGVERSQIEASVGTWLYWSDEEIAWWSDLWADRLVNSSFGEQARSYGISNRDEQERLAAAWRSWGENPGSDAWFVVPCGELLIAV